MDGTQADENSSKEEKNMDILARTRFWIDLIRKLISLQKGRYFWKYMIAATLKLFNLKLPLERIRAIWFRK
jgi:hypothetical protein